MFCTGAELIEFIYISQWVIIRVAYSVAQQWLSTNGKARNHVVVPSMRVGVLAGHFSVLEPKKSTF